MKRKTLFIILLIPFIVAILGFVNVVLIKNFVEVDIAGIEWKYDESNGFKLRTEPYKLEAEPVIDEGLVLSEGNDLKWFIPDKYKDNGVATISNDSNKNYFFNTLTEGETVVTCSNEKGNRQRSFGATVYKDGTVIINPIIEGNGENISSKRTFGEYDFNYTSGSEKPTKKSAKIGLKIKVLPEEYDQNVVVVNKSEFIDFNTDTNTILLNGSGDAEITFQSNESSKITGTYEFNVAENGVNVYNYNDLLNCTNRSEQGEVVCMQTNLEALENTYKPNGKFKLNGNPEYSNELLKKNTHLFGNYDFDKQSISFIDDVKHIDSTYNTKFIQQVFGKDQGQIKGNDDVLTGIYVQKDFYGNGFVINGRELTYPNNGQIDKYTGKLTPNKDFGDLFLGPLTFVSIGNFDQPLIKAYGQDNSLMYVDGDNILLDDLNIQNTHKFEDKDGNNNIYNLEYTGTCVDVIGKNVTIQNSRLQNARNTLRVYDADGFVLKNSVLEKSREFLMKIGTNKVLNTLLDEPLDVSYGGRSYKGSLRDFFVDKKLGPTDLSGDYLINATLIPQFDMDKVGFPPLNVAEASKALNTLQKAFDNVTEDLAEVSQNVTIEDTYFYRSGIFSIAFDTYFNGPFLYNGAPSIIKKVLGDSIVLPDCISGVMAPTNLKIKGETRFYDWKDDESIDASCLIQENLSSSLGGGEKINIDDYFPMKYALKKEAKAHNYVFSKDSKTYLNTPIAWYGGGLNLSSINIDEFNSEYKDFGEDLSIDITKLAFTNEGCTTENQFVRILAKCVPMAAGFNPFKFITNGTVGENPKLFGEVPKIDDLRSRA